MKPFIEYANITLLGEVDLDELENYLSLNNYNFGIDKNRMALFVFVEQVEYVETILVDRDIVYEVQVY